MSLWEALHEINQKELPWFCTAVENKVNHNDKLIQKEIQLRLNHATGCMSIVYIFAMLESYNFNLSNKYLNFEEKQILKAWKHLRHSSAHGFDGKRANRYANDFDQIMKSENKLIGVVEFGPNSIILTNTIGYYLLQYLCEVFRHLLVRAEREKFAKQ